MKMDIDSWFYIILSIIILAVSALGKRKKKAEAAQKVRPAGIGTATDGTEEGIFDAIPGIAPGNVMNSFRNLEQILSGQQYETVEGESLEQITEEVPAEATEGVSMEVAEYENDIAADKNNPIASFMYDEPHVIPGRLFADADETRRAIIYSEILGRKEY